MSNKNIYHISGSVHYFENSDSNICVDSLIYNHSYIIDGIATQVWKNLDGKNTIGEIIEKLVSIYPAHETEIKKKTEELIDELLKLKMIDENFEIS